MTERKSPTELSPEELEAEGGQPLPDREAMSLVSLDPDLPLAPGLSPEEPPSDDKYSI